MLFELNKYLLKRSCVGPINHEVVYGGLLDQNTPSPDVFKAVIRVPGKFCEKTVIRHYGGCFKVTFSCWRNRLQKYKSVLSCGKTSKAKLSIKRYQLIIKNSIEHE